MRQIQLRSLGRPTPVTAAGSAKPRTLRSTATVLAATIVLAAAARPAVAQAPDLADQVEILRTTYGIPHIRAENLRAAGFALGWVQVEDYGERVVLGLVRARGELARHFGPDSLDS